MDPLTLLWDTTPLYPSPESPLIDVDITRALAIGADFRSSCRGRIAAMPAEDLLLALRDYEEILSLAAKTQNYAYLLFSEDSGSDVNKSLLQRSSEFANALSRDLLFFELEIMEIEEERYRELLADARIEAYRHYLDNVRKFRRHTLDEREEQLLHQKALTGVEAFSRLYDELSASFRFTMEIEGEEEELTGEEVLGLLHHPEASLREKAFSLYLERHGKEEVVFGAVVNNILLDHRQDMELRSYTHPMEATNIGNELSDSAVERLMQVTEENYPLAQEYFRLKARLLGIPRLKNSDIYAPLPGLDRKYSFEGGRRLVLDSLSGFSTRMGKIAERFFIERRIDVLPRPGKGGGAYCMGMTPDLPPYILLNYTGTIRDVSTLAHELGHGIHFVLAQRQSVLNYHPALPLAETASVFAEMLLTRVLLQTEQDPQARIGLLCAKIEDIIATTFRQNVLTRYEERIHKEREGGLLSSSALCRIWMEENEKLYGNAVEMIEAYRWGWAYISHFVHSRFYCYSYVFGQLLVLSLYSRYLEEGEAFTSAFEEILAAGGAKSPQEAVAAAGVDLSDPGFWQKGYDTLADLLDELKRLL